MSDTFIMAALNGARKTKADHPNLPMTPGEVAVEAERARKAGAAAVHVHARDAEGMHTLDAGLMREVTAEVRQGTAGQMVIQATTELVGIFPPSEIGKLLRALKPEAASIAIRELLAENTERARARDLVAWLDDAGCWLQIILYDANDVSLLVDLAAEGFFGTRLPTLLFVLGRYTPGQKSTPDDLAPFLSALKAGRGKLDAANGGRAVDWAMCAFGPREADCAEAAIVGGGHARVGFENNIYLPDGSPAEYTADLVTEAARRAGEHGRTIMDGATLREWIAARRT